MMLIMSKIMSLMDHEKDDDDGGGGGGGGGNDEESQEPMYLAFAMLTGLWRLSLSAL